MTHWIFLISTLAVVYCRPQESPAVEIEKQHVVEIYPESKQLFQDSKTTKLTEKQLEESTKQILEKIALVNEKQGLTKKKPKPYQHFPFSYLRSQENAGSRESTDFKFPRDPFTNPILDYIEGKHGNAELKIPEDVTPNDNNEADDVPPGHYIKRKITHHQTMIVPNTGYFQGNMFSPLQQNVQQYLYGMHRMPEVVQKPNYNVMTKGDLEKQTVDNIKNIVENSRYAPEMPYNPYSQPLFTPYIYQQPQQSDNINVYGPYTSQQIYRPGKQQLQWPLAQYFPIVFKDPFIQLMNAFTSMVEYGPQAAPGDSCKKELQNKDLLGTTPQERTNENIGSSRANQVPDKKLTYSLVNNGNGAEITVTNDNDSNLTTVIDIEDLQITDNRNDPVQLNLNLRQSKQNHETTQTVFLNTPQAAALLKNPVIETLEITKTEQPLNDTSRQSPPIRDQILFDDEVSNEEEDKAEDIHVSHHGTKKLVSKDNTGSGIFVHKIKVRKGGVAIAGPGGIATAGSGGTAIVGPNGFAYTHPDSLAIAGSGTKVVAVEPNINLSQVILDHNRNKTRGDGHLPPRLGKIVAVGPVIYYNKGYFIDDVQSKVTIIPFYGGGKGQSLQIIERPDGTVITHIIQTPVNTPTPTEEVINTAELENPPLPSKQDLDFGSNIRKIHRTAINIIKLQEIAKKNGKLNTDEESLYQQNMDELNSSAKNLAQLQEQEDKFSFENREGVNEWFERKKSNKKDKDKKKKEEEEKKKEEERKKEEEEERRKEEEKKKEEQNKAEEEERRKKEEEKNKNEKPKEEEEEEEGEDEDNDNDGIAIGLPPDDASVAEAKPVGLAVAGEGGVAASKPIATAVVGPGGLAIARPVGTAIAGVAPDQALVPIYAEGYVGGNKPKRYGSTNKSDAASELLNKIISKYHQV